MKRPPPINLDEKDKQLQEKEAELRRMQEMVAQVCKIIYEEDWFQITQNVLYVKSTLFIIHIFKFEIIFISDAATNQTTISNKSG